MVKVDKETIKNLTQLSRIGCSEAEQEALLEDLRKILNYIELLQTVDTENVSPCNQVLEDLVNVMRDDTVGETLTRQEFLANVPKSAGGLVSVPSVMKPS